MKKFLVMLILLVFVVNVSAIATNITVVSEDVYTGAILKLRSLESGELGDPYYPFFVGQNVGIIKFEVETGLSETNLSLRFINEGEVCLNVEKGPFVVNGSEIIVDLRKVEEIISIDESVKNVEKDNVSEETSNEINSEIYETDSISYKNLESVGYATKDSEGTQRNFYVLIGIGIIFIGIFIFFIVQKAYKSGAKGAVELFGRIEIDRKLDEMDYE